MSSIPLILEAGATPEYANVTLKESTLSELGRTYTLPLDEFRDILRRCPQPYIDNLTLQLPSPSQILRTCLFQAPLTSLTLRYCSIWTTYEEMLQTLRDLQALQRLILNGMVPSEQAAEPAQNLHLVALPNLRSFELMDTISSTLLILKRLCIPSDIFLTVGFTADARDDCDWIEEASVFRRHIPDTMYQFLRYRVLHIDPFVCYDGAVAPGYSVTADVLHEDPRDAARRRHHPCPSGFRRIFAYNPSEKPFDDADEAYFLSSMLRSFVYGFSSYPADVFVSHPNFPLPRLWRALARHVSTNSVTATGPAGRGLLQTLQRRNFGALTHLKLQGVDLASPLPNGQSVLEALVNFLDRSNSKETQLVGSVIIEECDVAPSTVWALQEHPGTHKIEWEGRCGCAGEWAAGALLDSLVERYGELMID
ncbi:hypothetical protein BV25DRAFT_1921551 [Artomyces pyxidatus]|uniref:Uncharacterized protein n=1 Tax=Artomyces pyxidatus TaxID=48021 RepID=A0ACB8SHP5_9AGAM|nr:hypothetical protein BV25DRAFT_1921551 [Artomyces pyxidatus]